MKVTIELTEAQVKGLTEYLKEVASIEKVTKTLIAAEVRGLVDCSLQTGAIYDYISKYES